MNIPSDAMTNGFIDVAVRIALQELPYGMVAFEGDLTFLARSFKQERDNRVLADVLGDVLLRVVRAHLLLIDVLLEDIAEHIGIDLVITTKRAFIKMPLICIEELKHFFKSHIANFNRFAVLFFNLMPEK